MNKLGKVYLVGAGPGDTGLITVKGMECIRQAEVIVYDRLVNPLLLEYANPNVELIYCGKLPDRHVLRQEKINELLIKKAEAGKRVVRLKGGDPSVFGRVGEEAEALAQCGIAFEIVPGITSGIAASTYAGIPVTHREFGSTFAMVTGHDKSKDGKPIIHWESLAKGIDTIAFYMGVGNLTYISEKLIENGRSPDTQVILIQWGTISRQKTLQGTLKNIVLLAKEENFNNPAIILVGDIVKLREKIKWFERKPLFGQQILVAQPEENQGEISNILREQGADVFEYPRIQCRPLFNESIFKNIVSHISDYNRIVFLSQESVNYFFEGIKYYQIDIRMVKAKLYGSTSVSQKALEERGFLADTVDGMLNEGKLLIISDRIDKSKAEILSLQWGVFDHLAIYDKEVIEQTHVTLLRLFAEGKFDHVIFPSVPSVEYFKQSIEKVKLDSSHFGQVICMGTEQAAAANKAGISVEVTLNDSTLEKLVHTLRSNRKVTC